MAILLNNGNYVKLCFENCFIDSKGIHIAYIKYGNALDRETEETITNKYNKLIKNCSDYVNKETNNIMLELGNNIDLQTTKEKLDGLLTKEQKERLNIIHNIEYDMHTITRLYETKNKELVKELKEIKIITELGYDKACLTKSFEKGVINYVITGFLSNQKFTYNDLYNELKKIFKKDGYSNC